MRAPFFIKIFIVFVLALNLGLTNSAQAPQDASVSKPAPTSASPVQDSKADTVRILYTGKSMGYFRIPDWQGPTLQGDGCKNPAHQKDKSEGAAEFEEVLSKKFQADGTRGAILLGTGDNFAPEIEARDFCEPPAGQPGEGKTYGRVGKELFDWDAPTKSWIRSDAHTSANAAPANGLFMIPTDNVASFFVKEGYAALVPGKQDFYFGPERMRELARFMATQPVPSTSMTLHNEGEGVQMLAANMVIETNWKSAHSPLPDSENPPWFIPRFPTAADLAGNAGGADVELRMSGLSDGAKVYPWFRGVTLEVSGANAVTALGPALDSTRFYLCEEKKGDEPRDPDVFPKPIPGGECKELQKKAGGKSGQYSLDFPWIGGQQFYTLEMGMNYGLCAVPSKANVKAADGSFTFCDRFSVYTPFFQSSGEIEVKKCSDLQNPDCYRDPNPYALLETRGQDGIPEDIAVFGVIDPQLGDNVGLMNLAWSNTAGKKYKTETYVVDPAEPLKEMLDSFNRRFDEQGFTREIADGKRRLVKVLLAQMTSEEAQVLGTRLKQFQVVVSAADQEMATVGDTVTWEWNTARETSARHPMVLAIPEPYFVSGRGVVDIGQLDIHFDREASSHWTLQSNHVELEKPAGKAAPKETAPNFWKSVEVTLKKDCLPEGFAAQSQADQIQVLTLCEMQRETRADVALLQERDFFRTSRTMRGTSAVRSGRRLRIFCSSSWTESSGRATS